MRFDSIKVRGFGPFDDEISLDLREQEGRVVAVTGANGAGKSTLLELLAGALYRRMPTRGTLKDLATSRDAYVEVGLQNGAPWTVRQRVDAVSGKGEAEVLDAEGRAVLGSTKVKECDRWISDHLPSADVLYASAFGAQGSQGFLDLDPTDRKRVILTTLGHTRLEQLAKAAGEQARARKAELDTLLARIADERERGADPEAARAALDRAKAEAKAASEALQKAQAELVEAQAEQAAHEAAKRERATHETKRQELDAQLGTAERQLEGLDERIRNNEALGQRAEEIRQAVADVERLQGELDALETKRRGLDRQCREAIATATHADSLARAARQAEEGARRTAQRLRERLADRETIERVAGELQPREAAVRAAKEGLDEATAEVERLEALRLEGKDRRIAGLRGGLKQIRDTVGDPVVVAKRHLEADGELAEELSNAPDDVAAARAARGAAERAFNAADHDWGYAKTATEQLADLHETAAELEEAEQSAATHANEAAEQEAEATVQREAATDAKAAQRLLQPDVDLLHRGLAEAQRTAKLAPRLDASEARLEELRPQREAVAATIGQLTEQLSALGESPPLPEGAFVPPFESAVEDATKRARSAEAAVAVRQTQVAQAEASGARLIELEGQRRATEEALADWRLLERDLGRDGVQALEADAAGPELTELANDLLENCHGPRFRVRIETVRPKKSGKGEREGCWVYVHDTERGREDEARTYSGGERVIVSESVNLALVMLGVRHAGLSEVTVIRDESGAALDADNGRAYVAMLRRAADLVGASKVLFVTHAPELADMADGRIEVGQLRGRPETDEAAE